ncbi:MAG: FAD-dependent oxidoreductase [Acidobacteria bacterium]|nr:FAD-dependent oxidoreductase [Acidobacteriota bacterium]
MPDRLLIIGGNAAGMTAATWARRQNSSAEIIVVEKTPFISYSECGIPYVFSGQINSLDTLIRYQPQELLEKYQIKVLIQNTVESLNLSSQFAEVKNLAENKISKINFDYLVIATGAKAKVPNIEGLNLAGVFTLRHMPEAKAIDEYLKKNKPRNAVILGAGYIGLEMAEALRACSIDVTIIESSKKLLGNFDGQLKAQIINELNKQKVKLLLDETIHGILGSQKVEYVSASSGVINTDLVIIAIGISPEVSLARSSNIRLGASGAIAVKETLQTNFPNVYAAGDCAEVNHIVLDKPYYFPLGTTANKQGRVAGINIAGGRAKFTGIVGTQAVKVFDLEIATTGLSIDEAKAAGFWVKELSSHSVSRAGYYPGSEPIFTSLLYDERTGKVLGGQMIGYEGVAKRIDVIATALFNKMKVEDLLQLDLSYAPPFAPVWDPILYTVRKLK